MFIPEKYFSTGDTKREAELLRRGLDFGDDFELQEEYEMLTEDEKDIVYKIVDELTGGSDNFGYNLNIMLQAYRDPDPYNFEERVDYSGIVDRLYDEKENYWDKTLLKMLNDFLNRATVNEAEKADHVYNEPEDVFSRIAYPIIEKKIQDAMRNSSIKKSSPITEKQIADIKKQTANSEITEKTVRTFLNAIPMYDLLKVMCECFMFDIEVLEFGIGHIYEIDDLYFKDLRDVLESEYDPFDDYIREDPAFTSLGIARAYEEYLKEHDGLKNGRPVVTTRWAVINTSGKYLMFKDEKVPFVDEPKNVKANAVKALIKEFANK